MKNRFSLLAWASIVLTVGLAQADDIDALIMEMKKQIDWSAAGVDLSTTEEPNAVKVVIRLPKVEDNTPDSKFEISADGGALDGVFIYGGHKIKITITDGLVLRVSHKYASKESDAQQGQKAFKQMTMASDQSTILPVQVGKLENTKADFVDKDGNLILRLPKAETISRGWTKIEVTRR